MAKYKLKSGQIDKKNNHHGLEKEDWKALNDGKTVELNDYPWSLHGQLKKVPKKKKE